MKFRDIEIDEDSLNQYIKKCKRKKEIKQEQLIKIHKRYGNNVDEIMDKIVSKYQSKEYKARERQGGHYDSREFLFDIFLDYARVYGIENIEKLKESFATESYNIGIYNITLYQGQGSHLIIEKQIIRPIQEAISELYDKNANFIGNITSTLQSYDIRVRIKSGELEQGYYFKWNDHIIKIDSDGRLDNHPDGWYDEADNLLMELM